KKPAPVEDDEESAEDLLPRLRALSDQRRTLIELDGRVQDSQQLAAAYGKWAGLIGDQARGVLHLALRSMAWIFGVLLAAVLAGAALPRALGDLQDRRRLHQQ